MVTFIQIMVQVILVAASKVIVVDKNMFNVGIKVTNIASIDVI